MAIPPFGAAPGGKGLPLGLTGATSATRYVGGTVSGAPITGTFSAGDFVISEDGLIWIYNGTSWANPPTAVSTTALGLTLTTDTVYEPNSYLQGNTALLAQQNQTQDILPAVSSISQDGSKFTIQFVSSILGTKGQAGDIFQCFISGFTPSGWNIGSYLYPVIATVTAFDTITIPSTATPGAVTAYGTVNGIPVQYTDTNATGGVAATNPGYPYPRAIIQAEGTNKFINGLDGLYGIGPVVQNAMFYTNGVAPKGTYGTTNGSANITRAGSLQAGIGLRQKVISSGVPSGTTVQSISTTGGTNTITMSANYIGPNASETISFAPDIATGEGFVNTPIVTASGTAVSFPLQSATFGAPGEGQGWQIGYWDGPVFTTVSGASLSNINSINFAANGFFTGNTNAIERVGMAINDAVTKTTSTALSGTLNYQYGLTIGQFGGVRTNFYPLYGGAVNAGFLNASTTIFPSAPMSTTVSTTVTIPPNGYGTTSLSVASVTGFPSSGSLLMNLQGSNPGHYISATYGGVSGGNTFTGIAGPTPPAYTYNTVAQNLFTTGGNTITRVSSGSYLTDTIPVTVGMFILDNTTGGNVPGNTFVTAVTATTITTSKALTGTSVIDTLSFANGNIMTVNNMVLSSGYYQIVAAGFTVQSYGTKADLYAATSVSAVTGSAVIQNGTNFDGQVLIITNIGPGNLTFTSGTNAKLALGSATRIVGANGTLSLCYDATSALWQETGFSAGNQTQGQRVVISSGASSTCTPTADSSDIYQFQTSAGGALTIANPTGTPADGQKLTLRVKNTGSTPSYTSWGANYRASSNLALPLTTVASKWDYFGFIYNTTDTKWDFVALNQGF